MCLAFLKRFFLQAFAQYMKVSILTPFCPDFARDSFEPIRLTGSRGCGRGCPRRQLAHDGEATSTRSKVARMASRTTVECRRFMKLRESDRRRYRHRSNRWQKGNKIYPLPSFEPTSHFSFTLRSTNKNNSLQSQEGGKGRVVI